MDDNLDGQNYRMEILGAVEEKEIETDEELQFSKVHK